MDVTWIMIPVSLLLAFSFLAVFILASKGNQFEDLDSPAYRMLIDEENTNQELEKGNKNE